MAIIANSPSVLITDCGRIGEVVKFKYVNETIQINMLDKDG